MEETESRDLKCAKCYNTLEDPVQLPTCLHILCFQCKQELESGSDCNIICPQCNRGRATLTSHVAEINNDYLPQHVNTTSQEAEQSDDTNLVAVQCPICNGASCKHMQLLRRLMTAPQNYDGCCKELGHVDSKCQLKFFCKVCWHPVCEVCSIGKHKLHETVDISDCYRQFAVQSLEVLHEKLLMLIKSSKQDFDEGVIMECQLENRISVTNAELNVRGQRIIEQTKRAISRFMDDAELNGQIILAEYRERLNKIGKYKSFLQNVEDALPSIYVGMQPADFATCVTVFNTQEWATELIQEIDKGYQNLTKHEEQLLVLPEMEAINTPPPALARVRTEMKQLKLDFCFKLQGSYYSINSIVLTDIDQCLLSVTRSSEATDYDNIICYHYKGKDKLEVKEFDVDKGRYFLSRLTSGEIVASYSQKNASKYNYASCSYSQKNASKYKHASCSQSQKNTSKYKDASCSHSQENASEYNHAVLYCNGILPKRNHSKLDFETVHRFQFSPYGIATTKDNNIILCVNADETSSGKPSEGKYLSSVISMSLRGLILENSLNQPDANLMRPDYVAVSDSGEICISDTENSSIVILNKNLTIKERMNYQLPTSMQDVQEYQFKPYGTCYDTYGRIIVADPDNNSVVRMVRATGSDKYILEPLLDNSTDDRLIKPKLVALGIDSRLWVVCSDFVLVFEYCI